MIKTVKKKDLIKLYKKEVSELKNEYEKRSNKIRAEVHKIELCIKQIDLIFNGYNCKPMTIFNDSKNDDNIITFK